MLIAQCSCLLTKGAHSVGSESDLQSTEHTAATVTDYGSMLFDGHPQCLHSLFSPATPIFTYATGTAVVKGTLGTDVGFLQEPPLSYATPHNTRRFFAGLGLNLPA